jgi:hypothetical protein
MQVFVREMSSHLAAENLSDVIQMQVVILDSWQKNILDRKLEDVHQQTTYDIYSIRDF